MDPPLPVGLYVQMMVAGVAVMKLKCLLKLTDEKIKRNLCHKHCFGPVFGLLQELH